MFLFCVSFSFSVVVTLHLTDPSQPQIWNPRTPHTIVIFQTPFDPSLSIELLSQHRHPSITLTHLSDIFGINFGIETDSSLRFSGLTSISFEIFEPEVIGDGYILSTLSHDTFSVSSGDICTQSDFSANNDHIYSYIALRRDKFSVSTFHAGLPLPGLVGRRGERDSLKSILPSELNGKLSGSGFSEWKIQLPPGAIPRAVALTFDSEEIVENSGYPPARMTFTNNSMIKFLRKIQKVPGKTICRAAAKEDLAPIIEREGHTKSGVSLREGADRAWMVLFVGLGFALVVGIGMSWWGKRIFWKMYYERMPARPMAGDSGDFESESCEITGINGERFLDV
jgi:hypothetical protein